MNLASFTANNLASDPLNWFLSAIVLLENISNSFWISFGTWNGGSVVMFCTIFVITWRGSQESTSYLLTLMSLALFRGSLHINAGGRQIHWSFWVSKFDNSDFVSLSVQILWFSNSTAISSWRSFWNGFVSPLCIFFHSSPFVISVRRCSKESCSSHIWGVWSCHWL